MATKHYYAMHTPQGNTVDSNGTPIGTVYMFAKKRERDDWAEDNEYNTRNGNANQTRTITEHQARVTMLRQYGHAMAAYRNRHGLPYTYREYAQYYPTALMVKDYDAVANLDPINTR